MFFTVSAIATPHMPEHSKRGYGNFHSFNTPSNKMSSAKQQRTAPSVNASKDKSDQIYKD